MSEPNNNAQAQPVLAATTILLRDSADGPQVFMMLRQHDIDRFSGALVFPGGKLEQHDTGANMRRYCRGEKLWDDQQLALRIASIRETFEESGVLLARHIGAEEILNADENLSLESYRLKLERGDIELVTLLQQQGLELATELLVHFAHWVTPQLAMKRFDTHFFLAPLQTDFQPLHDGREAVDSVWATPGELLAGAERGEWTIVFPTRCNLSRLTRYTSTKILLQDHEGAAVRTITPQVTKQAGRVLVSIPEDAGYPLYQEDVTLQNP